MSGQWFVKRGGKVLGPFTAARLKALALAGEGKLKPTDEVREAESDDWMGRCGRADDGDGLAAAVRDNGGSR